MDMLALVVVAAVAGVAVAGLMSTAVHRTMVEQVNLGLSPGERFDDAWWGPGNRARLVREYRRLYPNGPLLRRNFTILGIGAVLIATAFAGLMAMGS